MGRDHRGIRGLGEVLTTNRAIGDEDRRVTPLPPEDQPEQEFETASFDAALSGIGPQNYGNPSWVAFLFFAEMTGDAPDLQFVRHDLVTPESATAWGDFAEVRAALAETSFASRCEPAVGDPDVVYAKFLVDDIGSSGDVLRARTAAVVNAKIATLVRRPELAGWRVHAVGDYMSPEQVPHGQ